MQCFLQGQYLQKDMNIFVKNMDFVNVNQLKALDGVINVVLQQTKIQIVIGPKVQQVYDQLELLREQSAPSMVTPSHQRKTSLISRILDTISRIFIYYSILNI